MPTITFQPSGRRTVVPPGSRLIDAVRQAGFDIPAPCGEKGLCGKCRVKVVAGDMPAGSAQTGCLPGKLVGEGWRASCVATVDGDLVIDAPVDVDADGGSLTDFAGLDAAVDDELWTATVSMAQPSKDDQRDDSSRLLAALADAGRTGVIIPPNVLADLPRRLRDAAFHPDVVGLGRRLLAVRPAGSGREALGLAVDLGTTTMAAALCDLRDGTILALSSLANPQSIRGDDVISRIDYASRGRDELAELRRLAVEAITDLSRKALSAAGRQRDDVLLVAVAGNTVMNHILMGVDPTALALSPFIPGFRRVDPVPARDIGWRGANEPLVMIVPNIAAYVGGDITAGILAHDVTADGGPVLFLDVGTNGEIVLAANGTVHACAAAAGPAFEGARIRQGMRAVPGAISGVAIAADGGLDIAVVDNQRPAKGICGTGLLDAVAACLDLRVVDDGGRMLDADEAEDEGVPEPVRRHLHEDDDGPALWLEPMSGHDDSGVALTGRDVREFQLAKGAIAAGARVLLRIAGVKPEEVEHVLLAGGFGNYLRPAAALRTGLLPQGIRLDRVRSVGNASLAGARLYLLSGEERDRADAISREVKYIELSGRDDFQIAFAEEMMFPEA
ncbi:MAG: ASKHA domain-containing protein [Planctomycetaceae bacterium]|nr:ASKHA domain-containing protein [Planctomycetaceae bacterium]